MAQSKKIVVYRESPISTKSNHNAFLSLPTQSVLWNMTATYRPLSQGSVIYVKDGSSQITEVEEAQTYVKQVETARAEEAAKYGELTL